MAPPAKPSKNPRDKQDLDYVIAILLCSKISIIKDWKRIHMMTRAMGYNWSLKTVR